MRMSIVRALRVLAIVAVFFGRATTVHATEPDIRVIPVTSPMVEFRMSPDGHTLAVFDNWVAVDGSVAREDHLPIELVDLDTGGMIAELTSFSDYATDLAFAPDGQQFATVHGNGDLFVWDAGEPDRPLLRADAFAYGGAQMSYLPDGRTLIVKGGGSPVFEFLDDQTGAVLGLLARHYETFDDMRAAQESHNLNITGYAVSPDGGMLATATVDDELATWQLPDGQPVILRPGSGGPGVNIAGLAFTADGTSLVYFDTSDKRTHVWDVADRVETASLPYGGRSFAIAPDGQRIAWTQSEDGINRLYLAPLRPGPDAVIEVPLPLTVDARSSVEFTPDGTRIVVGGGYMRDEANGIAVVTLP